MNDLIRNRFLLSSKKRALLKILRDEQGLDSSPLRRIPMHDPGKNIPLTSGQEGLWFLSVMEAAGVAYSVPLVYRLKGSLVIEQLIKSLNTIISRHEILRTHFEQLDNGIVQVISPQMNFDLPFIDVSVISASERLDHIRQLILDDVYKKFDLERGPLMRGILFQEEKESYVLYLSFHHIILDEWSLEKLILELELDYRAGISGQNPALPELPVQYADFASWTRGQLDAGKYITQLDFWKKTFSDLRFNLDFPTDKPRPGTLTFHGNTVKREISGVLFESLRELSHEQGITSFVLFLSIFVVLLSKYSRSLDLLVGTPVANRSYFDVQNLIGYFLNTLVIRVAPSADLLFTELLQQVKTTFLDAMENQDLPFERLVKELNPDRGAGIHPLFQVMFVQQNHSAFRLDLPGIEAEYFNLDFGWSKFDLTLFVMERQDGIELKAEYRNDIFEQETMVRLLEHYEILLREAAHDRHRKISNFSMLVNDEKVSIRDWNDTRCEYTESAGIHQLVESQVNKSPDAIAVQFGSQQLTYWELNQHANQFAALLQEKGIQSGSIVGLSMERSLEMMICLLGIIKAGGAVLPLDPNYPSKRLEYMCSDAGLSTVISHPEIIVRSRLSQSNIQFLTFNKSMITGYPTDNPIFTGDGESLLYVLYTSGSTGQPKGVMMPHRPLVNLITWQMSQDCFTKESVKTAQYTSLNFDVSFQEIFSTWCSGSRLVLMSEEIRMDFDCMLDFLIGSQIERLFLPFVALQAIAESAQRNRLYPVALRDVITAGEQLRITPEISGFFQKIISCRLHNHYGPTEAHVVSSYVLEGDPNNWPVLPPIGKPIANTKIFFLDPFLQPTSIGKPGEIYLAGDCLAQGYLNQPELTAERFIVRSIDGADVRLYRTGDMGRYLKDGNILYLGRTDQQVKIRGFRVEPGEIEKVLSEISSLRQAAVIPRKLATGETRLEAYIIPDEDAQISVESLREVMRSQLPDFMLPAAIHVRDSFPLTPSGKIDRRALEMSTPDLLVSEIKGNHTPPRDDLDRQLCQIWEEILETGQIGILDNFFELGGHSLLAVRLFTEIEKELSVHIPVASLFQAPTISQQADLIREKQVPSGISPIITIQGNGTKPPFFCIHNFGGFVINYEPLSQALGTDQPFYGLQAYGLEGINEPHTTILEMAHYYYQAIRQKQPAGPYYLGGYCFGGVVAYDVASLLSRQGEKVGLLALIDAYAPSHAQKIKSGSWGRFVAGCKNLPYWLRDFSQLNADEKRVVVNRRVKRLRIALQNRLGKPADITVRELVGDHANVTSAPDHLQHLMELHMLALMKYSPPTYDGKVTLFRIQRLPLFTHYEPDLGWSQCAAGGVELHIIPGAHHNALMPPFVQGLADELRLSLENAYRQGP